MELPPQIKNYNSETALVVDQGSKQAGWVVIGKNLFKSGCIKCSGIASYDRIIMLFRELQELIDTYEPEIIVFEGSTIFTHRNAASRIILCHLHYRMQELGYFNEIPTIEIHSPTVRSVWKALIPNRYIDKKYTKDLLRASVESVFKIKEKLQQDEIDAIAIAYVFALRYKKLLADILLEEGPKASG